MPPLGSGPAGCLRKSTFMAWNERKRDVDCPFRMSIYVYGLHRALVAFLSSLMAFCFVTLRGLYFTGTNKAIVGHVYRCLVYFSLKITLSYSPSGISSAVDWNMK